MQFKITERSQKTYEFDDGYSELVDIVEGTYYSEEFKADLKWWMDSIDGVPFNWYADGDQKVYDELIKQSDKLIGNE